MPEPCPHFHWYRVEQNQTGPDVFECFDCKLRWTEDEVEPLWDKPWGPECLAGG